MYFLNSQFFQTFLEFIILKSGREIEMQPCPSDIIKSILL